MRIDRLELNCFRNYGRQAVGFDPRCNVIFGENAQGKTNLLESLVYLSCGKSPRAKTDREMIGFDAAAACMSAGVFAREREFSVRVELFRDRRRRISVNQVPAKNSAALSQVYQTVFFCPEDLQLIRDGAAARRRFLDMSLCQLRPRYAAALTPFLGNILVCIVSPYNANTRYLLPVIYGTGLSVMAVYSAFEKGGVPAREGEVLRQGRNKS